MEAKEPRRDRKPRGPRDGGPLDVLGEPLVDMLAYKFEYLRNANVERS